MTERAYVLTDAAEADLRGIIRHTRAQWGDTQLRRYITKLEQAIAAPVAGQRFSKDLSALYPALRVGRCERASLRLLPATPG